VGLTLLVALGVVTGAFFLVEWAFAIAILVAMLGALVAALAAAFD
jgi:hypothetical protein